MSVELISLLIKAKIRNADNSIVFNTATGFCVHARFSSVYFVMSQPYGQLLLEYLIGVLVSVSMFHSIELITNLMNPIKC